MKETTRILNVDYVEKLLQANAFDAASKKYTAHIVSDDSTMQRPHYLYLIAEQDNPNKFGAFKLRYQQDRIFLSYICYEAFSADVAGITALKLCRVVKNITPGSPHILIKHTIDEDHLVKRDIIIGYKRHDLSFINMALQASAAEASILFSRELNKECMVRMNYPDNVPPLHPFLTKGRMPNIDDYKLYNHPAQQHDTAPHYEPWQPT